MNPLLRAAAAGAASGCRTFTGVSALALATPPDAVTRPDRTLRNRWAQGGIALFGVQELVIDKLPQTPSRVGPLGLSLRATAAAAGGVIVARRAPKSPSRSRQRRPASPSPVPPLRECPTFSPAPPWPW